MQRLEERRVPGAWRCLCAGLAAAGLDRARQQAVRGVHVTVAVEQPVGGRHRRGQRPAGFRVGPAGLVEQERHVLQVAGHVGTDVRRLGQPRTPVRAARAQLGGPQQGGDGTDRVTPAQGPPCRLLEQARDFLIGSRRGLGKVPGAAFWLVCQLTREGLVRGAALLAGRKFHDGRPGQRMQESQPFGILVHPHQAGSLGQGEALSPGRRESLVVPRPVHSRLQHPEITGAVQRGHQQRPPRGGGQAADPGREQGLQAAAQGQERRQSLHRGPLRVTQRCGQLEQGQRIAPGLGEQAAPDPFGQIRKTRLDQAGRGGLVQRPDFMA